MKTSGTNGLRLTPREERRGPSASGLGLEWGLPGPLAMRVVKGRVARFRRAASHPERGSLSCNGAGSSIARGR